MGLTKGPVRREDGGPNEDSGYTGFDREILILGSSPGHTRRNEAPMYAVIRAYTGNSDLADALVEHEEDIRRLIGGINGFKAYYLLKLAEGTSTISIFEDEQGAEESSRAAAAWLAENLPDLNVAAPYVTAGNVLVGF
jgi:hypothetical protein